jgi:ABC-type xylose transport system substrate-binding protein
MNEEVRKRIEEELDREDDLRFFSPKKIGKVLSKFDIDKRYMDGKPQYFGGVGWSYEKARKFMDDILKRYSIDTAEAVAEKDAEERKKKKIQEEKK